MNNSRNTLPTGFSSHDHAGCISHALQSAEAYCDASAVLLTPARRHVLEILLRQHRALGAYEILDIMREGGASAQPPKAYRALDFLVEHGFVHRVEKLNAFVACAHPGSEHRPAFLICRKCDAVAEAQSAVKGGDLAVTAKDTGFSIEATVIEAEGICPNCREDAPR